MNKDEYFEAQEQQYNEDCEKLICKDAAIFILEGFTRPEALEKAEAIFSAQEEADGDVTGVKATLDECQSPKLKPGTENQVAVIAAELYQQRNPA